MCTVSFIPVKDQFFITSNRDEKSTRKIAHRPALREYNGVNLIFPKDSDAGGTWIALRENSDAAVLLNGAFIRHFSQPFYRKSRGLLLLDIFSEERPSFAFEKISLTNIEPFTLVLFEKGCLYESRWDGNKKYCRQLSTSRPHIWSSVTLYDELDRRKREQWFASFLNRCPNPTQSDVLNFHSFSGDGDSRSDLVMNRDDIYATVSITSIFLTADRGSMKYLDLASKKCSEVKFELQGALRA